MLQSLVCGLRRSSHCLPLRAVSRATVGLQQGLNLVPGIYVSMFLEKERNRKQDYRCDGGCHLLDFGLAVVIGDFMLDETPPNLVHPTVSVAV
jgi:hypothetical protein